MNKTLIKETYHAHLAFIKVVNGVGLTVIFCSLGASIFSIDYLGEKMTYNPKNIRDFLRKNVYHGKTIGRVAGRIKDSKIVIKNKTIKLASNEGVNTLHGGKGAISEKAFKHLIKKYDDKVQILFSYLSRDCEAGFPGDARIEICYTIYNKEAKIDIDLSCKVSETCPISLTNHSYFCLAEHNINNLSLYVNASQFIEMNPINLVMERAKEVPSFLDFRSLKPLINDIDHKEMNVGMLKGYDHFLLLDKQEDEKPQISLENSKFRLDIFTDFDGVVIYTDNYDPKFKANNSKEKIRRGIAIEPQLNSLGDRLLNKNELFKHYITYRFEEKH